eukprot:scaffold153929_cov31-Tisochrysis_lutea.AAC.8
MEATYSATTRAPSVDVIAILGQQSLGLSGGFERIHEDLRLCNDYLPKDIIQPAILHVERAPMLLDRRGTDVLLHTGMDVVRHRCGNLECKRRPCDSMLIEQALHHLVDAVVRRPYLWHVDPVTSILICIYGALRIDYTLPPRASPANRHHAVPGPRPSYPPGWAVAPVQCAHSGQDGRKGTQTNIRPTRPSTPPMS